MNHLVSIVIPTYNRPRFVCDAIRSCLAQTYQNWELIICDNSEHPDAVFKDGKLSFEGSYLYYGTFNDPRIRYHWNGGNLGATESTNRGMAMATGKYIKILMDDDLLKPRCLEQQVAALEANPSCAVACAPMDIVDETGDRITPRFYLFREMQHRYRYAAGDQLLDKRRLLTDFLTCDYPCCVVSGVLFRAAALRKQVPFCEGYGFANDLKVMLTLAAEHDFYYQDEVLSSWRLTDGCHTARLHRDGHDVSLYYKVTDSALNDPALRRLFAREGEYNFSQLVQDAMFFCDARACLNFIPAAKRMDWKLLRDTLLVLHANKTTGWAERIFLLPIYLLMQAITPPKVFKNPPKEQ